jgi:phospholipase/lecithinase/hemolysin
MLHTITRWTLFTLALALASLAHAAGCQNRFVAFGDSLSDPGNFYEAFGVTVKAPFAVVPDAPYAIGGHHFSNGPTWAEKLADRLDSPASGAPAFESPGVFTNYAVGGARARSHVLPYDLTTQVAMFLTTFGGHACPDALYVLWIGGDDLRDALVALPTAGPAGAGAIVSAAVTGIADNVAALWSAGARRFLILDAPDISHAPAVRMLGPGAIGAASFLSASFNAGLGQAIGQLQAALPQIRIRRFDDNALLTAIIATPAAFDLSDAVHPCLQFGVVEDAVCEEPSEFLFWDGIHPTSAGHRIVASAVQERVFD